MWFHRRNLNFDQSETRTGCVCHVCFVRSAEWNADFLHTLFMQSSVPIANGWQQMSNYVRHKLMIQAQIYNWNTIFIHLQSKPSLQDKQLFHYFLIVKRRTIGWDLCTAWNILLSCGRPKCVVAFSPVNKLRPPDNFWKCSSHIYCNKINHWSI